MFLQPITKASVMRRDDGRNQGANVLQLVLSACPPLVYIFSDTSSSSRLPY